MLLVMLPSPASAADVALRGPAEGVVNGAARLLVEVRTEPSEELERIEASLRRADGELQAAARHPLCDGEEACSRTQVEYAIDFDPRTGAPFLEADRTLPNGAYVLRLHLTRPQAATADTFDLPLTLSAPGSAPAELAAEVSDGEVVLSWRAAPEPDVTGYALERLTQDGWTALGELPADATSASDVPGRGQQAYRVVTLRPDGRGATYETASREVSVEVAEADGSPADGDGADDPPADGETGPVTPSPSPTSQPSAPASQPSPQDTTPPSVDAPAPDAAPDTAPVEPNGSGQTGSDDRVPTVTADGEVVLTGPDVGRLASDASPGGSAVPVLVAVLALAVAAAVWRWTRLPDAGD